MIIGGEGTLLLIHLWINTTEMKQRDKKRIIKVVETEDKRSLVVAINKFRWIGCLFRSLLGILSLLLLATTIVTVVYGYGFGGCLSDNTPSHCPEG